MKIKNILFFLALFIGLFTISGINTVSAVTCGVDKDGKPIETSIIGCSQTGTGADGKIEDTGLWGVLLIVINILTAGIGIAAVAGIVYGSVLYSSAGGNPDGIKKAKEIIQNVILGLLAYALMYAVLNWLIPGGVLN